MDGQRSQSAAPHLAAETTDSDSKANLKNGFLVLDIFSTPLRVRKAPGLSMVGGGVNRAKGEGGAPPDATRRA